MSRRKIYREDIKEAGAELMHLKGYSDTGIKDITNAVGIPKGSFYNHFENKEAFALEVLEDYACNFEEVLKQRLGEGSGSPLGRFKAFFEGVIQGFCDGKYKKGCLLGNFAQEMSDVSDDFAAHIEKHFSTYEKYFESLLQEAVSEKELPANTDTEQLASYILNSWEGALLRMKASRNDKPLRAFIDLTFNHVLR
jgi:TetR/AcrR family transcriptional repressor of nem operon